MEELRKIADTILDMLKTQVDCPAMHPELGYKVPILDLAVWVQEVKLPPPRMDSENLHTNCQQGGECLPLGQQEVVQNPGLENNQGDARRMVQQVEYQFFSKPSAPKTTLHATSVNPYQQKRTTFTQEVIRRLLRTRKSQNCSQKQRILSEYMQILKNSGYNSTFRKEILDSGIVGYNRILQADRVGEKPLYRSKN